MLQIKHFRIKSSLSGKFPREGIKGGKEGKEKRRKRGKGAEVKEGEGKKLKGRGQEGRRRGKEDVKRREIASNRVGREAKLKN